MLQSRRPGDKAVPLALMFSVGAALLLLFSPVPVDDRGEVLDPQFRGLAIAAREQLTGTDIGDDTTSLIDAYGAGILSLLALPVLVSAFAVWANRRPDRSRLLTYAMLGMAGAVVVAGSVGGNVAFLFYPALIALAVAGFRVRKADMPARMAERSTGAGGRGRVVDADSRETTGEEPRDEAARGPADRSRRSLWARPRPAAPRTRSGGAGVADDTPGGGGDEPAEVADEPAGDEVEYDPLAELEAEIEAEQATGDEGDDADRGNAGGRSRRSR